MAKRWEFDVRKDGVPFSPTGTPAWLNLVRCDTEAVITPEPTIVVSSSVAGRVTIDHDPPVGSGAVRGTIDMGAEFTNAKERYVIYYQTEADSYLDDTITSRASAERTTPVKTVKTNVTAANNFDLEVYADDGVTLLGTYEYRPDGADVVKTWVPA